NGRPLVASDARALIRTMSEQNPLETEHYALGTALIFLLSVVRGGGQNRLEAVNKPPDVGGLSTNEKDHPDRSRFLVHGCGAARCRVLHYCPLRGFPGDPPRRWLARRQRRRRKNCELERRGGCRKKKSGNEHQRCQAVAETCPPPPPHGSRRDL